MLLIIICPNGESCVAVGMAFLPRNNVPCRWGFIIAAVCGLFGIFAAYFLPAADGAQMVPLETARTQERLPDHSRMDINHVVVTPTPAYTKPKDVVRYVPKKTQAGATSLGLVRLL